MPPTFQGTMCVSVVELDSIAVRMDCHTGQWHWGWGQDQRKALLKKFTENNQPEAPLSTQAIPSSLGCSLSLSQVTPQGQKIDSSTFIQQKCLALINVSSLSCKWLSRWKYYKTFGSIKTVLSAVPHLLSPLQDQSPYCSPFLWRAHILINPKSLTRGKYYYFPKPHTPMWSHAQHNS